MRRSTRIKAALFPVIAAAATLLLAGCFQIGPADNTDDDTDTDQTSQPSDDTDTGDTDTDDQGDTVDVFSIGVGDCLLDPGSSDTVTEITVVDCGAEHNYEAFASSDVPDGDFPGDDAISAQADSDCDSAFQQFIGVAYDDSQYLLNYFVPTEGSWAQGDREILCLVADPSGSNTGSLEGANQ